MKKYDFDKRAHFKIVYLAYASYIASKNESNDTLNEVACGLLSLAKEYERYLTTDDINENINQVQAELF